MGVVQNIIGMVRDINDRKRTHAVNEQLKNYLHDPNAAIAAVNQIDAPTAIALDRQRLADESSRTAATNAAQDRALKLSREFLRGLPEGSDTGAAFDQISPFLQQLGVKPEMLTGFRSTVTTNPNVLLDDKAYEDMMKDRFTTQTHTPGSIATRGGKEILRVPYKMDAVNTPAGSSTNIFNPNTGRFETGGVEAPAIAPTSPASPPPMGAQPSAALSVEALRPLFVAQESSGDYTAVNKETGALGRYQIMPDTGRALAAKIGVAWRPDMMRRNDAVSQRYQDALGNAAIQESIDFGGGDPARTFSHYYGGSDTRKWGPKTRKYTAEMMDRLSGGRGNGAAAPAAPNAAPGGAPVVTPTGVVVPPKPTAPKNTYRAATPQELAAAGYPKGTAAQVGTDGKLVNVKTPPAANQMKPYDQEKARGTADGLGTFVNMATELLNDKGLDAAVGNFQGRLPGLVLPQAAVNFRNKMDSFKSNIGLNKLMELKAASTQGASGFGNLSNEEGRRLEQAFGTLETTNDEKVIRDNLRVIIDTSRRAQERIAWQAQRAEAGLPWNAPAVGTIKQGKKFLGGSPANPRNWQKVGK